MLKGLNHITIAVKNLNASFDFYVNILGFKPEVRWNQGAYLTLNELWFCLLVDNSKPSEDYTHIAFDVSKEDFPKIQNILKEQRI